MFYYSNKLDVNKQCVLTHTIDSVVGQQRFKKIKCFEILKINYDFYTTNFVKIRKYI